jgi:hypothetical protein
VVFVALARIIRRLTTSPLETSFAFAFCLTNQVNAFSIVQTPGAFLAVTSAPFLALIDLNTFHAVAPVASLALAFERSIRVGASSVGITVVDVFFAFVDLLATIVATVAW